MTDNEIIKALECCHENSDCGDCMFALHRTHDGTCVDMLHTNTIDLINRLQAENERLKELLEKWKTQACKIADEKDELTKEISRLKYSSIIGTLCPMWKAEAKAEAIKEFAEILKTAKSSFFNFEYISIATIDFLLKEMIGE